MNASIVTLLLGQQTQRNFSTAAVRAAASGSGSALMYPQEIYGTIVRRLD